MRCFKDPEVARLQNWVDTLRIRYDRAEGDVVCEKEGTCGSGRVGAGIAYNEKVEIRDRLRAELQVATDELSATKRMVYETVEKETRDSKASAGKELESLREKIRQTLADKQNDLAEFINKNKRNTGLLARMEALGRLTERHSALETAYWVLLVFIIIVEARPALAKFFMSSFGKANLYDRLLVIEERDIEQERESESGARQEARDSAGSLRSYAAKNGHELEKEATEKITRKVVDAQVELAERIVDEWKAREMGRVSENLDYSLREDESRGVLQAVS